MLQDVFKKIVEHPLIKNLKDYAIASKIQTHIQLLLKNQLNVNLVKDFLPGTILERTLVINKNGFLSNGFNALVEYLTSQNPHHIGVYMGNGQVVHFSGEQFSDHKKAVVQRISLENFARAKDEIIHPVLIKKEPIDVHHGKIIIEKAMQILNDPHNSYNGNYNPLTNNCESFAKECYESMALEVYGLTQVEKGTMAIADRIADFADTIQKHIQKLKSSQPKITT